MWLLDVNTLKLEYFMEDREIAGKYAILSHTWDKEEVTFADIHTWKAWRMKGYQKIKYTCQQAIKDNLKYAWVDTCCINKDSSAELSEAINSMYRWYQNSAICYVYLADVSLPETFNAWDTKEWVQLLRNCRWFTRGWTLQEMIAPPKLDFYDEKWSLMYHVHGIMHELREQAISEAIATITSVDYELFRKIRSLESFPLVERLHWASRRQTTRIEDSAYSLLGLLGVNMPLLYGEGSRAFIRLQEELLRTSMDISILLWEPHSPEQMNLLIAPDPKCFRLDLGGWWKEDGGETHRESLLTNRGLRTAVYLVPCTGSNPNYTYAHFGSDGWYVLLRKVPQVQRLESAAALPVYEVVRAPIKPDRIRDIGYFSRSKAPSLAEIVILRRARSCIWNLDCDAGLAVSIGDRGPTNYSDSREIVTLSGPILVGRNKETRLEEELVVTESYLGNLDRDKSVTYKSYDFERRANQWDVYQCKSVFDKKRLIEMTIWGPNDAPLQSFCVLPPQTLILRVWLRNIDADPAEIYRKSLPTQDCISRLWKIENH